MSEEVDELSCIVSPPSLGPRRWRWKARRMAMGFLGAGPIMSDRENRKGE
jgi:hypothetical protein